MYNRLRAATAVLVLFSGLALADYPLQLIIQDGAGDSGNVPDVTRTVMRFDNTTGDYQLTLDASMSDPFVGEFQVLMRFYNGDAGTSSCNPAFFVSDQGNVFNLGTPTDSITLAGNSPSLVAWGPGDRIFPAQAPFNKPTYPLDCRPDNTWYSTVSAVPEGSGGNDLVGADRSVVHEVITTAPILADRFEPAEPTPNRPPVAGPSRTVTLLEDQVAQPDLTGSDLDGDDLFFSVEDLPGTGSIVSVAQTGDTSARAEYVPAADFFGTDSFTFVAEDAQATSPVAEVILDIRPVNDAPSFTGGDITIESVESTGDNGIRTIPSWATDISTGPANESGQGFLFQSGTFDPTAEVLDGSVTVSNDGTLEVPLNNSIDLCEDVAIELTVDMVDFGGTDNGGEDRSGNQEYTITVDAGDPCGCAVGCPL